MKQDDPFLSSDLWIQARLLRSPERPSLIVAKDNAVLVITPGSDQGEKPQIDIHRQLCSISRQEMIDDKEAGSSRQDSPSVDELVAALAERTALALKLTANLTLSEMRDRVPLRPNPNPNRFAIVGYIDNRKVPDDRSGSTETAESNTLIGWHYQEPRTIATVKTIQMMLDLNPALSVWARYGDQILMTFRQADRSHLKEMVNRIPDITRSVDAVFPHVFDMITACESDGHGHYLESEWEEFIRRKVTSLIRNPPPTLSLQPALNNLDNEFVLNYLAGIIIIHLHRDTTDMAFCGCRLMLKIYRSVAQVDIEEAEEALRLSWVALEERAWAEREERARNRAGSMSEEDITDPFDN